MRLFSSVCAVSLLALGACSAAQESNFAPATDGQAGGEAGIPGVTGGSPTTGGGTGGATDPVAGGAGGTTDPVGTGGTDSGGGGSGGDTGGTAPVSPFKLKWRDDFDSFDTNRWATSTHTFDENLGQFTASNVEVSGGKLRLSITNTPTAEKAYSAAEVRTKETVLYGRVEARIKFAAGSGVVSSLFTYKDDAWNDWDEIDIEYFGKLDRAVQFNLITNASPGGTLTARPRVESIGVDPTADFHDYAFEWTPDRVRWFVDGQLRHSDTVTVDRLKAATRIRMNCWPANSALFVYAGVFAPSSWPITAEYDWISYSAWEP